MLVLVLFIKTCRSNVIGGVDQRIVGEATKILEVFESMEEMEPENLKNAVSAFCNYRKKIEEIKKWSYSRTLLDSLDFAMNKGLFLLNLKKEDIEYRGDRPDIALSISRNRFLSGEFLTLDGSLKALEQSFNPYGTTNEFDLNLSSYLAPLYKKVTTDEFIEKVRASFRRMYIRILNRRGGSELGNYKEVFNWYTAYFINLKELDESIAIIKEALKQERGIEEALEEAEKKTLSVLPFIKFANPNSEISQNCLIRYEKVIKVIKIVKFAIEDGSLSKKNILDNINWKYEDIKNIVNMFKKETVETLLSDINKEKKEHLASLSRDSLILPELAISDKSDPIFNDTKDLIKSGEALDREESIKVLSLVILSNYYNPSIHIEYDINLIASKLSPGVSIEDIKAYFESLGDRFSYITENEYFEEDVNTILYSIWNVGDSYVAINKSHEKKIMKLICREVKVLCHWLQTTSFDKEDVKKSLKIMYSLHALGRVYPLKSFSEVGQIVRKLLNLNIIASDEIITFLHSLQNHEKEFYVEDIKHLINSMEDEGSSCDDYSYLKSSFSSSILELDKYLMYFMVNVFSPIGGSGLRSFLHAKDICDEDRDLCLIEACKFKIFLSLLNKRAINAGEEIMHLKLEDVEDLLYRNKIEVSEEDYRRVLDILRDDISSGGYHINYNYIESNFPTLESLNKFLKYFKSNFTYNASYRADENLPLKRVHGKICHDIYDSLSKNRTDGDTFHKRVGKLHLFNHILSDKKSHKLFLLGMIVRDQYEELKEFIGKKDEPLLDTMGIHLATEEIKNTISDKLKLSTDTSCFANLEGSLSLPDTQKNLEYFKAIDKKMKEILLSEDKELGEISSINEKFKTLVEYLNRYFTRVNLDVEDLGISFNNAIRLLLLEKRLKKEIAEQAKRSREEGVVEGKKRALEMKKQNIKEMRKEEEERREREMERERAPYSITYTVIGKGSKKSEVILAKDVPEEADRIELSNIKFEIIKKSDNVLLMIGGVKELKTKKLKKKSTKSASIISVLEYINEDGENIILEVPKIDGNKYLLDIEGYKIKFTLKGNILESVKLGKYKEL